MHLPNTWQLPQEIIERFGKQTIGRQRAMLAQGHLLLVLHKVPKADDDDREAVFYWRAPDGTWSCSGRAQGFPALKKHVEEYEKAADTLEETFNKAGRAEEYFHVLRELGPLKRAVANMCKTLQAAREGVHGDRDVISLRDCADNIDQNVELLYLEAKNALDYSIARKTEEQARLSEDSVHIGNRLNVLAAIFLPLTAIASVFGMNLKHGLEESSMNLFWAVLAGGIFLGFLIRGWIMHGVSNGR